jgi:hypothetical protein
MEAFRKIVRIKNHTLNLHLPEKFKDRKVEVIVLPADEKERKEDSRSFHEEEVIFSGKHNKSFSAVELNTKGFKFNREEANK